MTAPRRADAAPLWPALALTLVGCLLGVLGHALRVPTLEEVHQD